MSHSALLATVPSDAHSWPLVFMQMYLEEHGFRVTNLGPCAPFKLLEERCEALCPELVVISTVNGHGYLEGRELAERLATRTNRSQMLLVGGGMLGTDASQEAEYARGLREAGFDAVFCGPEALINFSNFLERELPSETGIEQQGS